MLIVLAGPPGSGKSAVADDLGRALNCAVLGVDQAEAAMRRAGVSPAGAARHAASLVVAALAAEQLALGHDVVVDAANGPELAREHWRELAGQRHADLRVIVVECGPELPPRTDELTLDSASPRAASLRAALDYLSPARRPVPRASGAPAPGPPHDAGMSFRLAAYAVCVDEGRVLLARWTGPGGDSSWTLPGGRVEPGEDPFDAVVREVAEETGCDAVVERLLGVDSRTIPAAHRRAGGADHQNIGIFYRVRITGGQLRPEPDGDIAESAWTPFSDVARLRRSSLVDVGIALARAGPATGHVAAVPVGGLIQH
ncbi:MAG TPA: NUDIX domain-containing protein [Streptosporangiaceae bacterium]|nr:NUDIX domain-containing protein [Streptosporangiaceae bacterium]